MIMITMASGQKDDNKKLARVISAKLSIEDYDQFQNV
jgi:hypothetical protein